MALVPSEVSLLQTYSVKQLLELENFSYDLIFPMDLRKLLQLDKLNPNVDNLITHPTASEPGSAEKRSKLPPLRTSFGFDEANQFEDSSSTPSSVQSDYFSFSGGGGKTSNNNNHNNWYSSRPNISQPDFQDNSLLFSPPKRYLVREIYLIPVKGLPTTYHSVSYPQSDSNLTNYPFGSGTGDTSPMDNSLYSSNPMSSPFKGDFNKAAERSLDYEPYHSRSSFNLNYSTSTPVPKIDRETMYPADLLVRK